MIMALNRRLCWTSITRSQQAFFKLEQSARRFAGGATPHDCDLIFHIFRQTRGLCVGDRRGGAFKPHHG
jgi:hypothetical protein